MNISPPVRYDAHMSSRESWDGGYVPGRVEKVDLSLTPKEVVKPLTDQKEINKAKDALFKAQSALSRSGLTDQERSDWEDKKAELTKVLRASGQAV